MTDEQAMKRAITLASRGTGTVSPNPLVGCIIIKKGKIIGKGWHKISGGNHAEVEAIKNATKNVAGATLVINLEPCNHTGKTPPCTDLIIEKKIARVVIGMIDPNPMVSGKGIKALQNAGIEVIVGVLENKVQWLNRYFTKFITKNQPYVVLKAAQSLDGCIATKTGESKWISCEESRKRVHKLRSKIDAVIVGEGTVAKDNPELTVKLVKGRNPKRIILDTNLSLSLQTKALNDSQRKDTFVFCTKESAKTAKADTLRISGITICPIQIDSRGYVHIDELLSMLASKGITSVLVEGGSKVFSSFLLENATDELHLFNAPIIIGNGLHSFESVNTNSLKKATQFTLKSVGKCGSDIHVIALKKEAH